MSHDSHHHHDHGKDFPCSDALEGPSIEYCSLEKRRLILSMVITGLTMLLEIAGGWWSGSLSLLSDAGHMFSHLFALGVSFCAILLASRPPTRLQSYGFYRAEILAALINGITLVAIVLWILVEAWERFWHPSAISGVEMFVIAVIGLIVNAITALLLKDASHHDLNIRGAFIHVLGDLGSSVGVVLAAVVIWKTGWTPLDPIVSALIALVILYWSGTLLKDAIRILLQATPKHLDPDRIAATLMQELPAIRSVHHIHVWELTSKMYVLTAHVELGDMLLSEAGIIRARAIEIVSHHFGIRHVGLEMETSKRP